MKHLAVSLIVISLLAAAFGADLWLDSRDQHDYGAWATLGLCAAVFWFFHHRDRR